MGMVVWYSLSAKIEISSSSLKALEVISFAERRTRLQVEAMNLESLGVGGKADKARSCSWYDIDFASCGQLRNLELFGAIFKGVCVKEFRSRFPLLESLIFYSCYFGEHIELVSQHLKRFVLGRCKSIKNAIIDTPNLRSFWFDGPTDKCTFCVDAPKLSKTTIITGDDWWPWNYSICNFLANLASSEKVTLYAEYPPVYMCIQLFSSSLLIPEQYTYWRPPLPSVKHLEFEVALDLKEPSCGMATLGDDRGGGLVVFNFCVDRAMF
ncbi:uncharacterized protein LOC112199742 [Rosa chinensis]|uniref:uncharacterized protein LOC112199742 n=1 Tax=Rosa chinensis TaxID=74649 RepID=UPI000D0966AD|nr:uncharacterized protein LOC112199742 [Rosa chinensis]